MQGLMRGVGFHLNLKNTHYKRFLFCTMDNNPPFRLRRATIDDMMLYLEWANDPDVRRQSFTSESISLEQHRQWFTARLESPSCYLYILENNIDSRPVGQIRFDIFPNNIAEIGFSVDYRYRGRGIGYELLKYGSDALRQDIGSDIIIQGKVKHGNTPSHKAFQKAGFSIAEESDTVTLYRL